jgi:hypothetical protein
MVGPFFYINSKELGYRGYLCHKELEDTAYRQLHFITSAIGHDRLFDKRFPHTQIEYFDFPRGRVAYDTKQQEHIIYIDRCIAHRTDAIANLFGTEKYRVEYDEHYVCKDCMS